MLGTGTRKFIGPNELLNYQLEEAIANGWPVTDWPVYPEPFAGTVRHPDTPDLAPNKWTRQTYDEKLAKTARDRLKRCDEMHAELEILRNYAQLVSNIRADQLKGLLATNTLLPAPPPSALTTSSDAPTPPPDAPTPPLDAPIKRQITPRQSANILSNSDKPVRRNARRVGGERRRKTRRKRRKSKRTKRLNKY